MPRSRDDIRKIVQANRSKGTRPELAVRALLTSLGHRYRLNGRDLPGSPDLVSGPKKKVVFVHGCFWHQHSSLRCHLRSYPNSNLACWSPKLRRTQQRDAESISALRAIGWKSLVVWECEIKDTEALKKRLERFLKSRDGRNV